MNFEKYIPLITTLASLLTVLSFFLSILIPDSYTQRILIIIIGILGAIIVSTFFMLSRKPSTLIISLLGPPGTGKSVYLTILFNELVSNKKHFKQISFQPYGIETIEHVTTNFKDLLNGFWIPATSMNDVFYFRANTMIKKAPFSRRYKLEIGDYAGEHLTNINKSSSTWYHKSSFFKDVISSDIIFLSIEVELLRVDLKDAQIINRRIDTELAFVAAIQILIQEKGLKPNDKSNTPIVLLLTKADKINEFESFLEHSQEIADELVQSIPRLHNLLQSRFKNYKYFLTSSVGSTSNGKPPKKIRPYNVVEPLLWSLKQRP